MDTPLQSGRAVRYACAVLADCRIGALPVDPFDLASRAGIMLLPLSQVENYPLWVPYDIADTLRMTCAVTLSYPTFCIVFRDTGSEPDRLRFALFHELGHIITGISRKSWKPPAAGTAPWKRRRMPSP